MLKIIISAFIFSIGLGQVLSGVGDALIPESERIASNVNDLEVGFDPSKWGWFHVFEYNRWRYPFVDRGASFTCTHDWLRPFTFEIEYETIPPITWARSYKDVEVSITWVPNRMTHFLDFTTIEREWWTILQNFKRRMEIWDLITGGGIYCRV